MTKTNVIEKTFAEIESLLSALLQEAADHTNDWKKNPNHPIRKEIEGRLEDLFTNKEKKLPYSLYELQEMLAGVIDGLPGFVNEKGETDKEALAFLTNSLAAFKELKNKTEEEEEPIIPTEGEFYQFLAKLGSDETDSESDSDEEWLENELKKEKMKNANLRRELASLKAKEEDRNNQLKQLKKKEQQTEKGIKIELELITLVTIFPEELTDEQLINIPARLREIKSWLITGTSEQQKVVREVYSQLKEILGWLKLEEKRRRARQRIIDALADKGAGKKIEAKGQELPLARGENKERYRDYSRILNEMNNSNEIDEFEKEMLQVIAKTKQACQVINEASSRAEKALSSKNVEEAKKARKDLLICRKMYYNVFLNKLGDFHAQIAKLDSFIKEQERVVAQVVQFSK